MVYLDACAGAHCIQEAVINRDTLWAGSQVLLPILATWTSPCRTWWRIPATRSAWASLGLFHQLRCSVRLDNERNFGLTLTTFDVNDGKHIVDQLLNRVVAPELLREVGTHVGPFCKWQGGYTDDSLQEYILELADNLCLPNQGGIEKAVDWLELCQRLFPVRDEMVAGTLVIVIVGIVVDRALHTVYACECPQGVRVHLLAVVVLENIIHTFGGCFTRGSLLRLRNVRPLQASADSRTSSACPSGRFDGCSPRRFTDCTQAVFIHCVRGEPCRSCGLGSHGWG